MFDAFQWKRRARRVIDLLEKERAALLSGRLDMLQEHVDRRERLVQELTAEAPAESPEVRAALAEIQEAAGRNQRLLDAYLEGLRAAQARLKQISRDAAEIGLYGSDGSRIPSPSAASKADRRA
ncbi:MAG: hypothetical protein AAGE18_02495 [Pseudomonadota bacterium]